MAGTHPVAHGRSQPSRKGRRRSAGWLELRPGARARERPARVPRPPNPDVTPARGARAAAVGRVGLAVRHGRLTHPWRRRDSATVGGGCRHGRRTGRGRDVIGSATQ